MLSSMSRIGTSASKWAPKAVIKRDYLILTGTSANEKDRALVLHDIS